MGKVFTEIKMDISQESIEEFKALYKKHFGEEISDKIATDEIRALLVMVELGLKPKNSSIK